MALHAFEFLYGMELIFSTHMVWDTPRPTVFCCNFLPFQKQVTFYGFLAKKIALSCRYMVIDSAHNVLIHQISLS